MTVGEHQQSATDALYTPQQQSRLKGSAVCPDSHSQADAQKDGCFAPGHASVLVGPPACQRWVVRRHAVHLL